MLPVCHSKHGGPGAELALCTPFSRARVWVGTRHSPAPGRERRLQVALALATSVLGGGACGGRTWGPGGGRARPTGAGSAGGSCAATAIELCAWLQCRRACRGAFGPVVWAEVRWVTAFLLSRVESFSSTIPCATFSIRHLCGDSACPLLAHSLASDFFIVNFSCESPQCMKQFSK